MATDPSWLYSTIAQSAAAIVAILGGFITASILNKLSEKRSLINQKEDKEIRIKTLSNIKENRLKELEQKETLDFLNSVVDELINLEKLPSLEEILQNYKYTQSLNFKKLKRDYEVFANKVLRARSFIEQHSGRIIDKEDLPFDKWVNIHHLDIRPYNYEILEKEYNRIKGKKQELLSEWERSLVSPSLLKMNIPYITPISEQLEQNNLRDKIQESKYEITSLENDVDSLNARLTAFSYPPHLRLGAFILVGFAFSSIILPASLIMSEVFSPLMKQITFGLFMAGLFAVIIYITLLITELRRK